MTSAWWLLLVPALIAAVVDVRSRRIPNGIVIPALFAVIVFAWYRDVGWTALAGMFVASGAGIAVRVVARGRFGAGDVKLLAYGGAAVGLPAVGPLLFGTAMGGGVLGVLYFVRSGRGATVPYGVAITLGLAFALLTAV